MSTENKLRKNLKKLLTRIEIRGIMYGNKEEVAASHLKLYADGVNMGFRKSTGDFSAVKNSFSSYFFI